MKQCRACGNTSIVEVLDLGIQFHTGLFMPANATHNIPATRLKLLKCDDTLIKLHAVCATIEDIRLRYNVWQ